MAKRDTKQEPGPCLRLSIDFPFRFSKLVFHFRVDLKQHLKILYSVSQGQNQKFGLETPSCGRDPGSQRRCGPEIQGAPWICSAQFQGCG